MAAPSKCAIGVREGDDARRESVSIEATTVSFSPFALRVHRRGYFWRHSTARADFRPAVSGDPAFLATTPLELFESERCQPVEPVWSAADGHDVE